MAFFFIEGSEIHIETDSFTATIATEGYTIGEQSVGGGFASGVKGGSFRDRKTGGTDLGFGLDIVDFLLEPAEGVEQDATHPYPWGEDEPSHGNLVKRYIELPQICTQAKRLPYAVYRGDGFVAVKQWWNWHQAIKGFTPGSLWEQVLVFPDGQRYFFASDRVQSVNDSDALILRIDMPGHLKHQEADSFSEIYLSHQGTLDCSEFLKNFPPDGKTIYQRDDAKLPDRFLRAYRIRTQGDSDPWLAGMTLNAADVYEGWCHQRGYVCFIQEIGGRPIKAGETFGAAYVIGFFDAIDEMNEVYDGLKGVSGLSITGDENDSQWEWNCAGQGSL